MTSIDLMVETREPLRRIIFIVLLRLIEFLISDDNYSTSSAVSSLKKIFTVENFNMSCRKSVSVSSLSECSSVVPTSLQLQ